MHGQNHIKYLNIFLIFTLPLNLQSHRKCWKCLPRSEMQAPSLFLVLLATSCRISVVTFQIQFWTFRFSSSSKCGLFLYTFSFNIPTKNLKLRDPEIAEATLRTYEKSTR